MICVRCGRDINALGQDNMSPTPGRPICETCWEGDRPAEHEHFGSGGSQWCDTCGEAPDHPIHSGEGDR